jgi:hypothetical protein
MAQQLTIGRIVRYVPDSRVDAEAPEWPAIVTAVHGESTADLQVFRRSDIMPASSVAYLSPETTTIDGAGRGHTWHWPSGAK